ncbi:ROK family protein [Schleiferilactobacillus harbinensis]|uniref:ROK family protein n=1 Tax=Schleiferilactobacillus harbinensis TaxID=304207 RepID=UPI001649E7A3|nr:ROK family protein [Schleiferilactobacillus harbinensis]
MMGNAIFAGIDLGGTNAKVALFDDQLHQIGEKRAPSRATESADIILENLAALLTGLLKETGTDPEDLMALGIGVPGLMDVQAGISHYLANFPQWRDVPVVQWFENRLHIPVVLDNDVRMNTYGEWSEGAAKGVQNAILLTLGTGVGAGIILEGKMLYGTTDSAGELGHMSINANGRPCNCGNIGCWERYVSATGLIQTTQEAIAKAPTSVLAEWQAEGQPLTGKMVSLAYDEGDAVAHEVMNQTGEWLGVGLVSIINVFNPERIIIGGGMAAAGERIMTPAQKYIDAHALAQPLAAAEIVPAALGDRAGMVGAAVRGRAKWAKNNAS